MNIRYVTNGLNFITYKEAKIEEVVEFANSLPEYGLDCEFNSLDVFKATLFLVIVGNEDIQYVIDARTVDLSPLNDITSLAIGHNIKIDLKILALNGVNVHRAYCTMIAEQRLTLGSGVFNNLPITMERRLGKTMEKTVRAEFVTDKPDKLILADRHIAYGAGDIEYLIPIKEKQRELINAFGMTFLIDEIEMPLVEVMARCDLEGFVLDISKWMDMVRANKQRKLELQGLCDELIFKLMSGNRDALQKYAPVRDQLFMFDDAPSKVKLNYGSPLQMKDIFKLITGEVPNVKGEPSMAQGAIQEWMLNNQEHPFIEFLNLYLERASVSKLISTYGESIVKSVKPRTGRLHTVFKQCSTDTGRFASGDSKWGFPNFQNIPAKIMFRHCFGVDDGYEVTTCDLSGAELIVMCSLAQDHHLLELSRGDMHSHMANLCWSNIYEARGLLWDDPISKSNKKALRTQFKAMTFGTIYGMYAGKAAQQLNVSKEEGQIVIDTISREIPKVFSMVKKASKNAMRDGYVIHNTRTNSRRWFTPVIDAMKELANVRDIDAEIPGHKWNKTYRGAKPKDLMEFKVASSIESAARNTRIQGTQADMVKEAIVEIDQLTQKHGWDLRLLGSVHDENIYRHPIGYRVVCPYRGVEVDIGDFIAHAMVTVANRYLDRVEMGADYDTCSTWTK